MDNSLEAWIQRLTQFAQIGGLMCLANCTFTLLRSLSYTQLALVLITYVIVFAVNYIVITSIDIEYRAEHAKHVFIFNNEPAIPRTASLPLWRRVVSRIRLPRAISSPGNLETSTRNNIANQNHSHATTSNSEDSRNLEQRGWTQRSSLTERLNNSSYDGSSSGSNSSSTLITSSSSFESIDLSRPKSIHSFLARSTSCGSVNSFTTTSSDFGLYWNIPSEVVAGSQLEMSLEMDDNWHPGNQTYDLNDSGVTDVDDTSLTAADLIGNKSAANRALFYRNTESGRCMDFSKSFTDDQKPTPTMESLPNLAAHTPEYKQSGTASMIMIGYSSDDSNGDDTTMTPGHDQSSDSILADNCKNNC